MADKATGNTIILHMRPCVRVYPHPVRTNVEGQFKTENELLCLKPGANVVATTELEKFLPRMKDEFESGILRKMEKPITSYTPDEAIAIIELTGDSAILRGFRSIEKRPMVVQSIDNQLMELAKIEGFRPTGSD